MPANQSPAEAHGDKWEGAEEWMSLAWELCANECGEEACTELIWEGGPIPEPWGDRWLKYEDQAKEMIAMVRKHVRAAQPQPKGMQAAVPMCSEQAVLHALTMARSETHQQGDAALWQAFGRAMWRQFNAMLPATQAPAPAPGPVAYRYWDSKWHDWAYTTEMAAPEGRTLEPLYAAPYAAVGADLTYSSTQATNCASCGKHKHTPLRIDAMGGYVCLTCIDTKLGGLLGEFGCEDDPQRKDAERYRWLRDKADYLRIAEGSPQVCMTDEWGELVSVGRDTYPQGEKLDAAIDEAMTFDVPVQGSQSK